MDLGFCTIATRKKYKQNELEFYERAAAGQIIYEQLGQIQRAAGYITQAKLSESKDAVIIQAELIDPLTAVKYIVPGEHNHYFLQDNPGDDNLQPLKLEQ